LAFDIRELKCEAGWLGKEQLQSTLKWVGVGGAAAVRKTRVNFEQNHIVTEWVRN
jgi:hypothetical protein